MSLKLKYTSSKFRYPNQEDFDEAPLSFRYLISSFQLIFNIATIAIIHATTIAYLNNEFKNINSLLFSYGSVFFLTALYTLPLLAKKTQHFRRAIHGSVQFLTLLLLMYLIYFFRSTGLTLFIEKPPLVELILILLILLCLALLYSLSLWVISILVDEITRHDSDLQLAQKIQSQLVPTLHQINENSHCYGTTQTAYEVGGDFFDSSFIDNRNHICAIGDVTGHDIAAGLLMAISKGAFHTLISQDHSLADVAQSMNRTIYENSDKKMFVSFSFCRFNYDESKVEFVNAGHLPLLHYKAKEKKVIELNPKGIAFGLIPNAKFEMQAKNFNRGDIFIFITDGMLEMTNQRGEEFGFERVKDIIEEMAEHYSPKDLYSELFLELNRFTAFKKIDDDVSFLACKIN